MIGFIGPEERWLLTEDIEAMRALIGMSAWDCPNLTTLDDGDEVWLCEQGRVFRGTVTEYAGDKYFTRKDDPFGMRFPFTMGILWTIASRKNPDKWLDLAVVKRASAVICKRCNARNDFGEPNQSDGSYVCFECR